MKSKDRRKHIRYPTGTLSYPIHSSMSLASKGRGIIVNVSLGGIQVETNENFLKNEEIMLGFPLPNGDIVEFIKCKVKWFLKSQFGNKLGAKFTMLRIFDKKKIKNFVNKEINLFRLIVPSSKRTN